MSHHHKHGECCSSDNSCSTDHGSHGDYCCDDDHNDHCHCGHHHKDFAEELLCMADCAWGEILKEKIKEEIKKKSGAHLDELARVVAESNCARWEHKLAGKKVKSDFRDKLACFFEGSCCKDKGNGNGK